MSVYMVYDPHSVGFRLRDKKLFHILAGCFSKFRFFRGFTSWYDTNYNSTKIGVFACERTIRRESTRKVSAELLSRFGASRRAKRSWGVQEKPIPDLKWLTTYWCYWWVASEERANIKNGIAGLINSTNNSITSITWYYVIILCNNMARTLDPNAKRVPVTSLYSNDNMNTFR